ncbi:type IV pilus inner membrane component PilO [Chitinimonas lacunae]|uniref:Type 4a pilus biogenesis protein PilO n=1 Tax=Chitinimonas lacunae TaxID=1963018 RepID=A0ABV8MPU4_9NEIS
MDELRRLDPKDIGNWPAVVQLVVLFVIIVLVIVLGYFLLLDAKREELEQGRVKEGQLKEAFLDKKQKAVNLEAYKQQLYEIQQSFGALLKQLPTKAEMETLITEINQSGVGRGLQFELFRPDVNERKTPEFAERPVTLRIIGTYHDLAAFASDVAQLSRIVTLTDMQLSMPPNADPKATSSPLTMMAVAKTYRALDPEESVQARKSQKKPQ